MDKKRARNLPEDLRGFEEFVEDQSPGNFLPRRPVSGNKRESSFENFTFLTIDAERLTRLKRLLFEKLPFAAKYEQGTELMKEQKGDVQLLQKKIFEISDVPDSPYRKSIEEVFNLFFESPKN